MNSNKAIETEIELMEKEILYLTGKKRERSRKKYLQLLRSCGKNCSLDEPIYLDRI